WEGARRVRTAITTITGRSAATEPFGVMSAVSAAQVSIASTSARVRLSPDRDDRNRKLVPDEDCDDRAEDQEGDRLVAHGRAPVKPLVEVDGRPGAERNADQVPGDEEECPDQGEDDDVR